MSYAEQRAALASKVKSREGKNQYTQGSRRDEVANGYSDCSSLMRWAHEEVLGIYIGDNTEGQINSSKLTTVNVPIKNGIPDESKMLVGDLLFFRGRDTERKSSRYVGHVEMYVGNDIDDILRLAYYNSGRKEKICNESLIFLDEFDKINLRGNDVSDKAVQNLLLNFLDGTVYDVEVNSGYRVQLDTTLMCIVLGGAFEDIFKKKKKKIGFGDSESELNKITITDADIIEYGFIPEIVGRCNPKILYNNLTREDLKNILLKGKLSPIYLKQQFYKEVYDVDLKVLDTYIEAVLDRVVDNLKCKGNRESSLFSVVKRYCSLIS